MSICTHYFLVIVELIGVIDMLVNQLTLAKELNECYIEYYNDFLTVERYSQYKGWSLFFARSVINAGRKINHNQAMLDAIYAHITE